MTATSMSIMIVNSFSWISILYFTVAFAKRVDVWNDVPCHEHYYPENCDFDKLYMVTVDDYDRCGPANLSLLARNYFLGAAGRRNTYNWNKEAFDKIQIVPEVLRDVSHSSLETTVLGQKVDFPIGLSPTAAHKLAHPEGELETVAGLSSMKTIMIVSCSGNTLYEDLVASQKNAPYHLWMQMYRHPNTTVTRDMLRRAETLGFKAIVLTSDMPILATVTCNAKKILRAPNGPVSVNLLRYGKQIHYGADESFDYITWLTSVTKLPIVAKGILTPEDAVKAAKAGASAILVSNHGGRQLDGDPPTIEALPRIVRAVKKYNPNIEVYMDGGIRSGQDAYKAFARGAQMVFVGRPIIWGLAIGGADGVKDVLSILRSQFNETMLLAGATNPHKIKPTTLKPNLLDEAPTWRNFFNW